MPELPEVETTIRYLGENWLNRTIKDVFVTNGGERQLNLPINELRSRLIGNRLETIERHGKWMLFTFNGSEDKQHVVGHLRMSGRYQIATKDDLSHPHTRISFSLDSGSFIHYLDQRRFGTWHLVGDFTSYLSKRNIGVDALSSELTPDYLYRKLQSTSRPIYTTLLDQRTIAGLGNIYVNEVLSRAKVHPLSVSKNLIFEKVSQLVTVIPEILLQAVELKGTTLKDNLYNTPEGKAGSFADFLQVYAKSEKLGVNKIKIGGRSVYFRNDQILY